MRRTGYARRYKKKRAPIQNENIPLEITMLFSSYIVSLQRRSLIDIGVANSLNGSVTSFTNTLCALERILTTPIPSAYAIHLKHATWLYLLILPWQLIGTLKYLAIPVTSLVAYLFLGLLHIGEQIENPFGYDRQDLNLDFFCHNIIRRELSEIVSHSPLTSHYDASIFSTLNQPFAPRVFKSAKALGEEADLGSIQRAMKGGKMGSKAHKSMDSVRRQYRQERKGEDDDGEDKETEEV